MKKNLFLVLILILMECLLRSGEKLEFIFDVHSLNPYSNGMLT